MLIILVIWYIYLTSAYVVVISGLYMMISGQASDQQEIKQGTNFVPQADGTNIQQGSMDESSGHNICKYIWKSHFYMKNSLM